MDDELAALSELPAARRAGERLLAGVSAHVSEEMRVADKPLVTQRTDKRPLSRVCPEVLQQVSRLLVAFVALQSFSHKITSAMYTRGKQRA